MDTKITPNTNTNTEYRKAIMVGRTQILTQSGQIELRGNRVDIVFVIDTTRSMSDKIEALLLTCRQFVDETQELNLNVRFGLISFGDISVIGGGDTIDIVVPMTESIWKIKDGLTNIPRNRGFGNGGETPFEAIQEALRLNYRAGAVKVLVLITDEPAIQREITADTIINTLTKREFLVFVIATSHEYYKRMARVSGGIWKKIDIDTNLSEILTIFEEIAEKVAQTAQDVHQIGDGSVRRYLELKPPD